MSLLTLARSKGVPLESSGLVNVHCCPQDPSTMSLYLIRMPFPSPGDLAHPGVKPGFPTLQADDHLSHQGSPYLSTPA